VEVSFSYAQRIAKIWPTWQDESGRLIRLFNEPGKVIETQRARGRVQRAVSGLRETKSRHAVKHNGSLLRLVDQL
jgi:hypothetical protein